MAVILTPSRRQRDLTHGSVERLVWKLATPSILESAMMSVVNLLHAYWMGQVGGMALAAVTIGTTLRIVLISPMMGLSTAGMAVVARHVGAREQDEADRATMQVMLLIAFFVTLMAGVGLLFGRTFLHWMGAQNAVYAESWAYVRIIFYGLFFMEMLPSLNGVIRGAGRPEYTLRISLVSLATMAALEPLLSLGWGPFPALGVRGAALASVISNAAGVAAQFATLIWGKAGVRLRLRYLKPDWNMIGRLMRIAVPASAQRFSPNLAGALFIRLVSSFGDAVLAAYSLVSQLFGFLQAPSMGLGNASATMVGQNLGGGQPQRAERAGWFGARTAAIIGTGLMLALSAAGRPVLGLFNSDPAVVAVGAMALWCYIANGAAQGWLMSIGTSLGGAGDALSPMMVHLAMLWLGQLPACYLLSRAAGLGPMGIWLGISLGSCLGALAMTAIFRRGRWKQIRI